ncbi:MAG: hypothetical protein AAB774_00840 [Patescibacteria group bacterium]
MGVRRTIIWAIVALLIGVTLGFGLRAPIASTLNLEAQRAEPILPSWDVKQICKPPKIWTGNGCADTNSWTVADWAFFSRCLNNAMGNPPPEHPNYAITPDEYTSCVRQTEGGKGR